MKVVKASTGQQTAHRTEVDVQVGEPVAGWPARQNPQVVRDHDTQKCVRDDALIASGKQLHIRQGSAQR
jgi:hypothetical protein